MTRRERAEAIYGLADRLREDTLGTGESILWPGERVWSSESLEEVAGAILRNPDRESRSFFEKLQDQLERQPDTVLKVAADINLVYHLFASNIGYEVKRKNIELVASWADESFVVPESIDAALKQRIGSPGMHYLIARPQQWEFYCRFFSEILRRGDPRNHADIRSIADEIRSKVRESGEARNIALHLLYPDTFERIVSEANKLKVVAAFRALAESDEPDVALEQIRKRLESERGAAIDFYDEDIKAVWASKREVTKLARSTSDERYLVGASGPPDPSGLEEMREQLAANGQIAVWFSYPLQEDHQKLLRDTGALYLYTGAPTSKVTHRYSVVDFRTQAGIDGMESPWPDMTAPDWRGRTRLGPTKNLVFKTWLLVESIDDLDPPLESQQFERPGGQPVSASALINGFGVWQLKSSGSGERWKELIRWARYFREHPAFDATERDYKLEVSAKMAAARKALDADDPGWHVLLKEGFGPPNNLTSWRQSSTFIRLVESSPDAAAMALRGLWDEEASDGERVAAFTEFLSLDETFSPAGEANLASVLLMAMGAEDHPPFQAARLAGGFKLTGFRPPNAGASASQRYAHCLEFYDSMIEVARESGLEFRDRLDAQSVLWSILQTPLEDPPISEWDEELRRRFVAYREGDRPVAEIEAPGSNWEMVASRCYMEESEIRDIVSQLQRRRQVVFYGPPGTGKTYVAQEIARAFVRESGGRHQLIQFHPSYSYEDFVEGLKPKLQDGSIEYAVEKGILRDLADEAAEAPDERFVLIVDEMNRANLAKVFGELFFLLEYRNSTAQLPYSKDDFSLPPNLYVIGTMNTADRSIAVVDFALRRRFGFVPFFPDLNQTILRDYLSQHVPDLLFVADMLARLNEWIGDRNYLLGHSYFMPSDPGVLDEDYLRDVWRYSIEPHLEEYWYDEPGQLDRCRFDALRQAVAGPGFEGDQAT